MTLKYRILKKLIGILPAKKIMAGPPEKTQKIFQKAYKGPQIPKIEDPKVIFSVGEVSGCPVAYVKPKKTTDKLMIYLVGGGMLKYPKPAQIKEVVRLAKECEVNAMVPYYPILFTGNTLPDVYEMLYALYKKVLKKYKPENVCFAGGSSGGNLAIGLVSYINWKAEGIPVPGKVYAGSPGTLHLTDAEREYAKKLEKTDVIMSVKAIQEIWSGMTGDREVPAFMKYLQLGDYTGLKNVYLSFGGDEVFLAAAESIKARLEEFGVHVTMEIGEGLYHSYAMLPLVKEAEEGYRNFKNYVKEWKENEG